MHVLHVCPEGFSVALAWLHPFGFQCWLLRLSIGTSEKGTLLTIGAHACPFFLSVGSKLDAVGKAERQSMLFLMVLSCCLFMVQCGASRTVAPIKAGFVARTSRRKVGQ